MTQDNAPLDESKKQTGQDIPTDVGAPKATKRRKSVKILFATLILLVLLVLFLPTIAGLGFVRSIVISKVNQNLDGRLEVDDWSLGWFSGITLRGVRLVDPKGEKVASIEKISTQLGLLSAVRGNYNLGKTNIDGCEFWVKLDEQGESNVAKLPKKHGKKTPTEQPAPLAITNISGDLTINAKGQIERPGLPIARITSATITAQIPNLTDPTVQDAQIQTSLGDGQPGEIAIHSKVPIQALLNVVNQRAPGAVGTIDVTSTLPNLQAVVTQLTSAVQLLPDVTITGGDFKQATHIDVREKDLAISNQLTLSAEGKRGSGATAQPIKLDQVQVTKADATLDPTKDSLAGLGNISLDVQSPFLTVQGGGTPTTGLNIPGTFDLDKLHDQLAQFFDLSKIKLAGTGKFDITTSGDVTATHQPMNTTISVGIQNLALALPDQEAIQIASLALSSEARVNLSTKQIQESHLMLQTGDGKATIIDCDITATGVDPASQNVKHFDVNKLNVTDLATAQQQLDPFVPALAAQGLRIIAGQLYTNVSGSIDGSTRTIKFDQGNPLELSTPGLTVQKFDDDNKGIDVVRDEKITARIMGEISMPSQGPMSANVKTLAIDTQHNLFSIKKNEGADLTFKMDENSIGGEGSLVLSANLKAIQDIARRLGGEIEVQSASAGQLTSGQLDATLAISNPKPQTVVQLDGNVTNISVTTADPKKPIANESVKISVKAIANNQANADASKLSAQATVESSFASVNVKEAELSLKTKSLEKAQLLLSAPDLAKLNAVAIAFMPSSAPPTTQMSDIAPDTAPKKKSRKSKTPPLAAPSSPIQVTSGSATLTLNVARDSSSAAASVGGLSADGLLTIPAASVSGMDIANLLIPITMEKGVAQTIYKDKKAAPPATCNGGTLDFSNIVCDLTGDTPRLAMLNLGKGRRIVHNVSVNPVLGDALGKFVNPVFTNSKQAKGLLDVTVTDCKNLALGDKLMSNESGDLRIVLSITDMEIVDPAIGPLVGGLVNKIIGGIPKPVMELLGKRLPGVNAADTNTFRGQIKDAVVSVEKGVAQSDLTLTLIDADKAPASTQPVSKKKLQAEFAQGMPLHFWGDVRLSDLEQSLHATVPTELVARYLRAIQIKNIDLSQTMMDAFPQGIPVAIKGKTTSPEFDYGAVGDVFAKRLGSLNPDDLKQVGNLVDQFLKKK